MTTLFRRLGGGLLAVATAAMLMLGLVAGALQFSSTARADSAAACADAITSAPTGPATVSAASTATSARCWSSAPATTPAAPCTCSRRTSSMR